MSERKKPPEQTGVVVSNKMNKTVVVAVRRMFRHVRVEKYVRRTEKFYAHDEGNACRVGDTVVISETRPMSKLKRWKVVKVVSHGVQLVAEESSV